MILVIILYALFASIFTVGKVGLEYASPLFLVGTRMLFAGCLMLGYLAIFRRDQLQFQRKHLWRILRLAFFNIYLTNVFEFWGLKYLTSSKTCLIYSLSPFVSALFSYWMLNEKMTPKKWLGLGIGVVGLFPVLLTGTNQEDLTGHLFFLSWAEAAVIGAAVSSVYGWILLRQLVKENGYSPLMANGLSMMCGGSLALLHSACVENWNPVPVTAFLPFLECAVVLMVVSNLFAYNLYGFLLRRYSATFMSFAGFTTPLFTALFGWLFLGESVNLPFYVSIAIVFSGLVLFHQEELKQKGFKNVATTA